MPARQEASKKEILLPGLDEDRSPAYMREPNWIGINRFIVIQSKVPFPPRIIIPMKEKLPPDSVILRELAEFYAAQPFDERKLFVLSVMVEKKE